MRLITILLIGAGSLVMLSAQTPTFFTPESLKANNIPIDVSWYGSPYAYDWNGDGKKDLLTGQFSYGYVRFYPNLGTNNNPSFGDSSFLEAGGSNISVYAS